MKMVLDWPYITLPLIKRQPPNHLRNSPYTITLDYMNILHPSFVASYKYFFSNSYYSLGFKKE